MLLCVKVGRALKVKERVNAALFHTVDGVQSNLNVCVHKLNRDERIHSVSVSLFSMGVA